MKFLKTVPIILLCCLLLCGCTININIPGGSNKVTPTVAPVRPSSPPAPPPTPAPTPVVQKQWSEWSTNYPYFANEIESRSVLSGYNMIVYVTQEAEYPHARMFRNYSIAYDLKGFGARATYGEKLLTRYASIEELNFTKAYAPGSTIQSKYCGKQFGTETAYCFLCDGKEYSYFIDSEVYINQYRYR